MISKFTSITCALAMLGCASQRDSFSAYEAAQKSGICNVHHIKMYKESVEIAYGLIIFEPGGPSSDTVSTEFPYADHFVLGGCVIGKDSPDRRNIYICSMCEKAQKQWTERYEIRKKLQLVPRKA